MMEDVLGIVLSFDFLQVRKISAVRSFDSTAFFLCHEVYVCSTGCKGLGGLDAERVIRGK